MDEETQEAPSQLTEGKQEQGHAVHERVPQAVLLVISGMGLSAEGVAGASDRREAGSTGAA